jgi:DNA-binding LacI/PurR family transcriptional regulator
MEDNIGAGEKVAAHLGGLGHKKVCIFGQYDDEYWCLTRIKSFEQGLKNLFREQAQVYRFLTKFDKLALRKGVNDNFISDEDKAMINGTISKAFGGYEFTHSDPSRIIRNEGWQLIQRDHSKAIMEPYFKEALSKKEVTAWVCTDDSITNAASEFLEKNNVSVPGDISLVGIDSNEFSIFYDTTFYDFRRSQIGYLAAHCILDDIPIKRNQMGLVDSPGRMIIRDSTRRIDG